jgi:hypothetical protein
MKPSVVMPVYNERTTLREIIGKVLAIPIESDDGSHEILPSCETDTYLKFFIFFSESLMSTSSVPWRRESGWRPGRCQRLAGLFQDLIDGHIQ